MDGPRTEIPSTVVEIDPIAVLHLTATDHEIRSIVHREIEITPSIQTETGLRTEFRVRARVVPDLVSHVLRADHLEVPLEVLLVEECVVVV